MDIDISVGFVLKEIVKTGVGSVILSKSFKKILLDVNLLLIELFSGDVSLLVALVNFFNLGEMELRELNDFILLVSLSCEEVKIFLAVKGRGSLVFEIAKVLLGSSGSIVRILRNMVFREL